jgi:hypothetical protein
MNAVIEFDWGAKDQFKKLGEEQFNLLRERLKSVDLPEFTKLDEFYSYMEKTIDLAEDGVLLTESGIEFKIKRFKGCYRVAGTELARYPSVSGAAKVVQIQVAIPNIALLAINEVKLLENSCTDQLQEHLSNGWRILAVCPPECQRRPDYILGRTTNV